MWDEAGVRVLVCMQAATFEVFWDDFVEAVDGLEVVWGGVMERQRQLHAWM